MMVDIACPAVRGLFNTPGRLTVQVAVDTLIPRLTLGLVPDYYSTFARRPVRCVTAGASEYLSDVNATRFAPQLMCPEMFLPPRGAPAVRLLVEGGRPWSRKAIGVVNAGRKGCVSPLHFDWDHAWVAHACLTGRKTFIFIPPTAGWLLSPVLNMSALALPRFAVGDRHDIVRRLGGCEVTLGPGEGVAFPSTFWHAVVYHEPSLSVSVRFEASPGGRPFAVLAPSLWLQRLVWLFMRDGFPRPAFAFLRTYLKTFLAPALSWRTRYDRVTALCRDTLRNLGERHGAHVLANDAFNSELALAPAMVRAEYSMPPPLRSAATKRRITSAERYLFDGTGCRWPEARQLAAFLLRRGQPPPDPTIAISQRRPRLLKRGRERAKFLDQKRTARR